MHRRAKLFIVFDRNECLAEKGIWRPDEVFNEALDEQKYQLRKEALESVFHDFGKCAMCKQTRYLAADYLIRLFTLTEV